MKNKGCRDAVGILKDIGRGMKEKLYRQLAIDYCCTYEEIANDKNHFTEYKRLDGRRRFDESEECALKVIAVNGKLVFTGEKQFVDACKEKFENCPGSWFMDVGNFRELEKILNEEGYRLKTAHPFFIPRNANELTYTGFEIRKYNQNEIMQFQGDSRFDEAFCFDENSPDMLGVAAVIDDQIVGMAGASADSPSFWQIGINVDKDAEGKHIGSTLVSILKHDIMEMGLVPYYGTSISNLASQRVAANAGFEVAWVELLSEKE